MFEPAQKDGPGHRIAGVLLDVWSNVWVKRLTLSALILTIAVMGGWIWFWSAALDATCRSPKVKSFTVDEFLDLRDRRKAYQKNTEPISWMAMSPDEATYLLAESKGLFVELAADQDRLLAYLGIPNGDGCYNVYFEGSVHVENSVLRMNPDVLRLGGFDLSWFLGGQDFEYSVGDVSDPQVAKILKNVRALKVESGELKFRLKNKSMKWEF